MNQESRPAENDILSSRIRFPASVLIGVKPRAPEPRTAETGARPPFVVSKNTPSAEAT
jgi:hypothetical protein